MYPYNVDVIRADMRAGGVSYRDMGSLVERSVGTVAEWVHGKRYMPLGARVHLWLRLALSVAGSKLDVKDYFSKEELESFRLIARASEEGTARWNTWLDPTYAAYTNLQSTSV